MHAKAKTDLPPEKDALNQHDHVTHHHSLRIRPLIVIPVVIVIMVALHLIGAVFLSKTGTDALPLNTPIAYIIFVLLVVFAIFKLRHLVAFVRKKD